MKQILMAALPGLFLFAGAAPAMALDCNKAMTQNDMNICAAQSYQAADKVLNTNYKRLMTKLKDNAPARDKLRTAQRAWLTFRDTQCDFEGYGVEGGSMQPLIVASCKAQLTKQRAKQLEDTPSY